MRKAFLDCEESLPRSGEPLYDGLDRQKRACTIPPFAVPVPRFYCISPYSSRCRRGVFIRPSSVTNGVIHLLNKSNNIFRLSLALTSQLDPISVWAKNMTIASNWEMDSSPRQQDHVVRSLAHIFLRWPLRFHIKAAWMFLESTR